MNDKLNYHAYSNVGYFFRDVLLVMGELQYMLLLQSIGLKDEFCYDIGQFI